VSPASQFQVVSRRRPAARERHHVVEFEPAGLAASAVRPNEGTPSVIARPHRAPDRRRHVPPGRRHARLRLRATRSGTAGLLEPLEEHRQRAVNDDGGVAAWYDVSQQVAGTVEPGPRLGTQRDLQEVAIRGEWGKDGAWFRRGHGRTSCVVAFFRRGTRRWPLQPRRRIWHGCALGVCASTRCLVREAR
jgi:hypothetical protein